MLRLYRRPLALPTAHSALDRLIPPQDDPNCYKNCGIGEVVEFGHRPCNQGPSACDVTWCRHASGLLLCGYLDDPFVDRCTPPGVEFIYCKGRPIAEEECQNLGYYWNYTTNECQESPPPPGSCPENCTFEMFGAEVAIPASDQLIIAPTPTGARKVTGTMAAVAAARLFPHQ